MTTALALLQIVAPVFLIVAAGYAAIRTRVLAEAGVDPMVRTTVTVLMPSLLFMAMLRVDLGSAVNAGAVAAFFGAITVGFFVAMALSRLVWRRRPGETIAVGFSAFFGNTVMLGIPIAERAYGGEVSAAVFGLLAFHGTYNYFVGFVGMEMIRRDRTSVLAGFRRAFVTTLSNPLMIGLLGGIAVNLSGLSLPRVLLDALDMLASAALPVALFSLGGVLTRYRLRDEIGEALMVSAVAMLVVPALAWALADSVLGLPAEFVRAAVILAAMPPGLNGYVFASLYNRAVGTAANSMLIGTVLSVGSITGWLALLAAWT